MTKRNTYNEDEELTSRFNWHDYARLGHYLRPYSWRLCFVLITILIGNIAIILGPYLMKIFSSGRPKTYETKLRL
ncbi:hypothetical protein WP50_25815 [Lactiplantibacillus plantarum]|nr:hypothetical protein WP50_25815 [Lactiplantibacillus plantarum]